MCLWCVAHRHSQQEVVKEAHLTGKGQKKGRTPAGKDSVSGFFRINLHAALENCYRHSEDLVKLQYISAVLFYTP